MISASQSVKYEPPQATSCHLLLVSKTTHSRADENWLSIHRVKAGVISPCHKKESPLTPVVEVRPIYMSVRG